MTTEYTDKDLQCPICGEPTSVWYGNARKDKLCRKHADMLKNGWIELIENGRYRTTKSFFDKNHMSAIPKYEETSEEAPRSKAAVETDTPSTSELTCIICGEPSNGKHFCYACYRRYKEKVVLLRISKCEFPTGEPLDESYEGVFECEDGHIVKSIAEQTIDNELYMKGIFHAYEAPLDIGEEKPLKPDFCLKNYLGDGLDVYVEYFGLKGQPKYDAHTKYKMEHYRRLGITLVCLYPKDSKNLKFALASKLFNKSKITIGQINYEE